MATLVNEGLIARAKLTGGVATAAALPFTHYALLAGAIPAEAITVGKSDIAAYIIAASGGEEAALNTTTEITYVASYKTQWQHTFTFTGTLTITGIALLNTDASQKMLMYHKFNTAIEVHDTETAQFTVTETEGRT